jgi:hypothetical protein
MEGITWGPSWHFLSEIDVIHQNRLEQDKTRRLLHFVMISGTDMVVLRIHSGHDTVSSQYVADQEIKIVSVRSEIRIHPPPLSNTNPVSRP